MRKIAILGGGSMGMTHAMAYESISGDFRVTAVSDAREENARSLAACFPGADSYASSAELLEKFDGDVADICLPTPLHKEYFLRALAKGLHVFCEKPLALTMEDAREVFEACRKTDRKVMVGHCIRFWPEYMALKNFVDGGSLGKLVSIVFKRIVSKRKPGLAWKEWIFDETQSGSAVIDLHIHDVDFIRFLLGEPDRIQALLYNNRGRAEHVFSNFIYGPVVINTEASWAYPTGSVPFLMAFTALFERGVVAFSTAEQPSLKVFDEAVGTWSTPRVQYPVMKSTQSGGNVPSIAGYVNELAYFLACIENDRPVEVASVEESMKSLDLTIRTAQIAYRAYRGEENQE
jgi:predicted dehydrogenase